MKTLDPKIDFLGNDMAESTLYFSFLILNFIFTPTNEIKIFENQVFVKKKICSRRLISNFSYIAEDSLDFKGQ